MIPAARPSAGDQAPRGPGRVRRALSRALATAIIGSAAGLLAVRGAYLLADHLRPAIAGWLGAQLELEVGAAKLVPEWHGWTPVLGIRDLRIARRGARGPGLRLADVRLLPDLGASLRARALRLRETVVSGLTLGVRREPDGTIRVRGLGVQSADHELASALLVAQRRLRFERVTLAWSDARRPEAPLAMTGVSLEVRAGQGAIAIAGSAHLGHRGGPALRLRAQLSGDPMTAQWSGRIYVHAPGLGAAALAALTGAPTRLDPDARVEIETWSEWRDGRLHEARGRYAVTRARPTGPAAPVSLPAGLGGAFLWQRAGHGWDAVGTLGSTPAEGPPPTLVRLAYRRAPASGARLTGRVSGFELGGLLARLAGLGLDAHLPSWLRGARPAGRVTGLGFAVRPGPGWRESLVASAEFEGIGFALTGLTGRLEGAAGRLEIDSDRVSVALHGARARSDLGGRLAEPLALRVRSARIGYADRPGGRRLELHSARLAAMDSELDVTLRARWTPGRDAPALFVRASARQAELSAFTRHLPSAGPHPRLLRWLRAGLRGAILDDLELALRSDDPTGAPLRDHAGSLRISARARVERLAYAPGWPALERARGRLAVRDRTLTAELDGARILGATVRKADARIDDLLGRPARLRARGSADASSEQGRAFLAASPLAERFRYLTDKLRPEGRTRIDLALEIPLSPGAHPRVAGRVRLIDNRLSLPGFAEGIEAASGEIAFGPEGLRTEGGRARYLGRPIEVAATRNPGPEAPIVLRLSGSADGAYLARHLRNAGLARELDVATSPLLARLSGETRWSALLEVPDARRAGREPLHLRVETELSGVRLALPVPFQKRAAERTRLVVDSLLEGSDERLLRVRYGDAASAALRLLHGPGGWRAERGRVHFGAGAAELPEMPGVVVDGRLEVLEVRDWRRLLSGGGGPGAAAADVRRVELEVGDLGLLGNRFARAALRAERDGEGAWQVRIRGPELEGTVEIPADLGHQPLRVDLDRVALAAPSGDSGEQTGPGIDPRTVPAFEFVTRALTWQGRALGSARMRTTRTASGMRIEHAFVSNSAFEATASGAWVVEGGRHRTRLRVQVHTDELAALLAALGYEDPGTEGAATEGLIDVSWPGRPVEFALERSAGVLHFRSSKGRLLEVRRGATGRLFGLLSLTSLPRRLLLDFSDLFKKGIGFARMEGSFALEGGNAYTSNLFLDGPVARIDIAGRTGLVTRDYDEVITVTPRLSASLPLAPIWLAEKLFRRRIFDRAFAYQYAVTGSWDDPQVERIEVEQPDLPQTSDRP